MLGLTFTESMAATVEKLHKPLAQKQTASIEVSNAVVSFLNGQKTGAGYLTLKNTGETDRVLTDITSACCDSVEMHEMQMKGDIMQMRPMETLIIPAGEQVNFASGGKHIMFVGAKTPVNNGDSIAAMLHFADGTQLPVTFTANLRGAGHAGHH